YDLRDSHESLADALLRDLEDGRLGGVDDFFRRRFLLIRLLDGAGGGVNQSAQQRFVFYDLDILLNVLDAWQSVRKRRNISHAAYGFNFFVLSQLFGERDKVDGLAGFSQLHHAEVNAAVGIERKIFRAQV